MASPELTVLTKSAENGDAGGSIESDSQLKAPKWRLVT
jgi:hypothetical protein